MVLRPQPKGLYQRTGIIITGKWFARQTAVYKADARHGTCREDIGIWSRDRMTSTM